MDLREVKKELSKIKRTSFGISIPEVRKFAKKLAGTQGEKFFEVNDFSSFELKLLHAFTIGYMKGDIDILLNYFEDFIPQVDDWAVNDSLCQNFKIARKYPEKVWNFIEGHAKTQKEFESRIVSVLLLSHFLNDEYIDRVIVMLDKLYSEEYYAQMGIAWAFATIMGKYPEKCLSYLKSTDCSLDSVTLKKTYQKIRESFRVTDDVKNMLAKK